MLLQALLWELKKLEKLELVVVRKDSNRLYYNPNQNNPLFTTVRILVLRTSGLVDILAERLSNQGIRLAFVYGSMAAANENAQSDVDLFVIGAIGLRNMSSLLQGADQEIGREINPFVITPDEYMKRRNANDSFLARVLSSPKLFVIGCEHELEAMGDEETGCTVRIGESGGDNGWRKALKNDSHNSHHRTGRRKS